MTELDYLSEHPETVFDILQYGGATTTGFLVEYLNEVSRELTPEKASSKKTLKLFGGIYSGGVQSLESYILESDTLWEIGGEAAMMYGFYEGGRLLARKKTESWRD